MDRRGDGAMIGGGDGVKNGVGSDRRSAAAILLAASISWAIPTGPVGAAAAAAAATTGVTERSAAPDGDRPPARAASSTRLIQAGIFEIGQGDSSAALGLELRFDRERSGAADQRRCRLEPRVGILLTSNGAGYLHAGVGLAVRLPARFTLTAALSAGLYENGQDVDLGGPVEFRSSLELTRSLATGRRVGALFQHLSNASLYERNPGVNSLLVFWSF